MTIDKQALRERHSPKPAPECHICGAEMTIQRMYASRITYGCTGATYDDKGYHYAEGRSIADDHYEQSRVTVVDVRDPDVLALLDELEAAEKRITELEAREILLPERSSMLHRTDFHEDYHTVMAYKVSDVIATIRAAGIRIKGE